MDREAIYFDQTYDNIERIIMDNFQIGGIMETNLVYVIDQCVPDDYLPSDKILAASVGCGNFIRDHAVIRGFHMYRYGSDKEVFIVGMDKQKKLVDRDVHDLEMRGEAGDASSDIPWLSGLSLTSSDDYDYIQILNPDLMVGGWQDIYQNALEYLSDQGILVTVCHGEDQMGLKALSKELSKDKRLDVSPIRVFEIESEYSGFMNPSYCFNYIRHD